MDGIINFIFSFFGPPVENAKGSYCDRDTRTDCDYYEEEAIDDEIYYANDRGDKVEISDQTFYDECINQRYWDDERPIEQGPAEPEDPSQSFWRL